MPVCANPECQKEFIRGKYAHRQIYCSPECNARMYNAIANNSKLKTFEQLEKIKMIAERQQDANGFFKIGEKCEVCGSTENLLCHEISYSPLIAITLCSSCHGFLHHRFLKDKKVRPHFKLSN
jgi:hypothetical protein